MYYGLFYIWKHKNSFLKIEIWKKGKIDLLTPNSNIIRRPSPIHSTSLEMSEVSSETDMLLISVRQQTDAAISR